MFTWDDTKREWTLRERGIDFADMPVLWDGRSIIEREDTRPYPERRFLRMGRIGGRLFLVGWTPRDGDIRILTARKCNDREEKRYGPQLPQ